MKRPTRLLLTLVLASAASVAQATPAVWSTVNSPTALPARTAFGVTYDSGRNEVLVFGGFAGNQYLGDTWVWNGVQWSQRLPASAPSIRRWPAMAYDAQRGKVVLFGGLSGLTGQSLNDTWEWDGSNWSQVSGYGAPSLRHASAMAYDAQRAKVVLFGGIIGYSPLAGTFEFNGSSWVNRSTPSDPPPAVLAQLTYNPIRGRCLLHGDSTNAFEWDGVAWYPVLSQVGVPFSISGQTVYSPRYERTVAVGGISAGIQLFTGSGFLNVATNQTPSGASYFLTYFDSVRMQLAMVGFGTVNGPTAAYLGSIASRVGTAGTGCGVTPLQLQHDPSTHPVPGQTLRATIPNAPTPLVFLSASTQASLYGPFPLPLPLDFLGMTGCVLMQGAELLGVATTPTASGREFAFPAPGSGTLIGQTLYMQAYAFAPGANPAAIVVSNRLDWTFGEV